MLFIMNLDWSHFAISEQVVEANNYLHTLAADLQVENKVIFNCASIKAGEKILPFGEGELGKNEMPKDGTLDYLRWHHQKVREALWNDIKFRSNRDVTEMVSNLKKSGHQIAAVHESTTCHLEEQLRETRLRDYFGDNVYGYDRRPRNLLGNFTLAALFATAVDAQDENYEETLVIADSPEAIEDAAPLQTRAIVGYLDPYVPGDEQTRRLKEMDGAGANYTVVGGHYVTAIPFIIKGRSEQLTKETLVGLRGMQSGPH